MKSMFFIFTAFACLNSWAAPAPSDVVCVKNDGDKQSTLILNRSMNEGRVPNYNLTYVVNGHVYLHFETSLRKSDERQFQVEGYISDTERRDVIGYAGYDLKTGKGYYQEAANDGMSPLPGTSFPSCKAF